VELMRLRRCCLTPSSAMEMRQRGSLIGQCFTAVKRTESGQNRSQTRRKRSEKVVKVAQKVMSFARIASQIWRNLITIQKIA
jgi:hypothetical protein